jgi:hypothetical protein
VISIKNRELAGALRAKSDLLFRRIERVLIEIGDRSYCMGRVPLYWTETPPHNAATALPSRLLIGIGGFRVKIIDFPLN